MTTLGARLKSWREERGILRFAHDELKFTPDPWQEAAMLAFASPRPEDRRISLQACVGPGKTSIEAVCGWWFLLTQGEKGEHPKGAAVAVTYQNLQDNLWAEFAKWQARSELLSNIFTMTEQSIYANDHPKTWFLSARSWPKSGNAEEQGKTLSGLHSRYPLVLIDESGTIPSTILRAGEQALSRCRFGKILQAGNPISLEGMLYTAATQQRHLWNVIIVSGDPDDSKSWVHSPRFADDHTARGECLCPKCWAREQIQLYGREDSWVKAYILGQFPPSSINALVTLEAVEAAMRLHLTRDQYEWQQRRLGVDVARYGDDRTVIFPRQGLASFRPVVMRHNRGDKVSTDVATKVIAGRNRWHADLVLMDGTGGWGAGALDVLRTANVHPLELQFGGKANDRKYANTRSEIWFRMAEWIKAGGALPPLRDMVAELTTPTYTLTGIGEGSYLVEPKKMVKKRLGRSPDLADALACTFGIPDQPRDDRMAEELGGRVVSDWNPFSSSDDDNRVISDWNPFRE